VADKYDRGFGHFTTRQNIQFNWIELPEIANLLRELSDAGLHAIQTSGKATRNITADPLSGLTEGEIEDARPYCELIRRWFNLHPEFSWLPGKFKIAINGAKLDETALRIHDLGLRLVRNGKVIRKIITRTMLNCLGAYSSTVNVPAQKYYMHHRLMLMNGG
jgi:sulfite reductase (NADPH) hemoprotein beta-component